MVYKKRFEFLVIFGKSIVFRKAVIMRQAYS